MATNHVASATASTQLTARFDHPEYVGGDLNGQNGWFALGNSPTAAQVVANPDGGSMIQITQVPLMSGVANGLNSPLVPGAGESTGLNGSVAATGQNQIVTSFHYRTPATPVLGGVTFFELNPSFRNPDAQTGSRYARANLITVPDTAAGVPTLFSSYGDTVLTPISLAWNTWYQFDYDLRLFDGLAADGGPNDTFCITVRDAVGVEIGTIASYSWEADWRNGGYGGGTGPRLVNGVDILTRNLLSSTDRGAVDDLTIGTGTVPTGVPAPQNLAATAAGTTATVSFDAPDVDNCTAVTGYTVTNDQNDAVVHLAPGESSAVVSGLTPATTYVFTVAATYASGLTATASAAPVALEVAPTTTTAPATTIEPAPTTTAVDSQGPAATTPVPTTTAPASIELPRTGTETNMLIGLAVVLTLLGGAASIAVRRRTAER